MVTDAAANPKTAIGVTGCAAAGIGGFCGGGGYLISKLSVLAMAVDPNFMQLYEDNCRLTQYCDITTAWMLKTHNTEVAADPKTRLHSWGFLTGAAKPDEAHHDAVYAALTAKLITHLRTHRVASLHYRGGQVCDDFETVQSKMTFLHRIFTLVFLVNEEAR